MKGKIEIFSEFDKLIGEIPKDKRFTALIEDWDEGFKVIPFQNGGKLAELINNLKEKYESLFTFRFFSDDLEISWNGEEGVLAKVSDDGEYEVEKKAFFLETDYGRFPGLKALKSYKKIEVESFKKDGSIIYMKFKKLSGG